MASDPVALVAWIWTPALLERCQCSCEPLAARCRNRFVAMKKPSRRRAEAFNDAGVCAQPSSALDLATTLSTVKPNFSMQTPPGRHQAVHGHAVAIEADETVPTEGFRCFHHDALAHGGGAPAPCRHRFARRTAPTGLWTPRTFLPSALSCLAAWTQRSSSVPVPIRISSGCPRSLRGCSRRRPLSRSSWPG